MTAPPLLRDDVRDLVAVCRAALRDHTSWPAMRDCEPGPAPPTEDVLSAIAAVGVLSARQLAASDGGLTLLETTAVLEAMGAELSSVPVAGSLAAGPMLAELDPDLAEQVATGTASVTVGVIDGPAGELRFSGSPQSQVLVIRDGWATAEPATAFEVRSINDVDPSRAVVTANLVTIGADAHALSPENAATTTLGHEVLVAAEAVGAARAACVHTVGHVKGRMQFDRAIGSFQAVKHALADVWCDIEVAAAAVQGAAHAVDVAPLAERTPADVAVAVSTAGDALLRAAEAAIHLHGGMGFAWESGMRAFLRRALAVRALLDPNRRCEGLVLEDLRRPF